MVSLSSIVSKIKAVKLFIPPRFQKSPRSGLFVVEAMLKPEASPKESASSCVWSGTFKF
jgi:hypothetical protein